MSAILAVDGLTKVYQAGSKPLTAVDHVTFQVARGEVLGLLGPNGAGKTTTIKCISGLILPTSGSVVIDGIQAQKHPQKVLAKVAAVLEGNRNIYWRLTPRENLEFFANLQGISSRAARPEIERLIDAFRLRDKAQTPAAKLSRGMQQRLAIACAFVKRTPVLFLDEPTLGLDVESAHELRVLLRELTSKGDATILLSSHDMAIVEALCQRVIIINRGKVVADDRVKNLLEVFRVRAYEITLTTTLGSPAREKLTARFPGAKIAEEAGKDIITVELAEGADFYALTDLLRETGAVIDAIDRRDPDLEQIMLKILQGTRN